MKKPTKDGREQFNTTIKPEIKEMYQIMSLSKFKSMKKGNIFLEELIEKEYKLFLKKS